jgi:Flp pilus assembly protein TadG
MTTIKSFWDDRRGGTAILFGLMLLPLMAAVGAAVDYSRAANVRTAMQAAADAAALLLARDGVALSNNRLAARAREVFLANFHRRDARVGVIDVEKTNRSIRVNAHGSVKTALMGIFRIDTINLSTTSEVGWG